MASKHVSYPCVPRNIKNRNPQNLCTELNCSLDCRLWFTKSIPFSISGRDVNNAVHSNLWRDVNNAVH